MASNAAVPFWRAAGMTYVTYSNICANLVRNCLKEPHKSESISREKVHFSVSKWIDGKPQKPSTLDISPYGLRCGGEYVLCCVVGEEESSEREREIGMASNAAVPFLEGRENDVRNVHILCANLVRNCLKEPHKSESISHEKVHFSVSKWIEGKPLKPS